MLRHIRSRFFLSRPEEYTASPNTPDLVENDPKPTFNPKDIEPIAV